MSDMYYCTYCGQSVELDGHECSERKLSDLQSEIEQLKKERDEAYKAVRNIGETLNELQSTLHIMRCNGDGKECISYGGFNCLMKEVNNALSTHSDIIRR